MYFSEKWNQVVDWGKSRFCATKISGHKLHVHYPQFEENIDTYGNKKAIFYDAKSIQKVLQTIGDISDNSLIFLPFDQSTGLLAKLLNLPDIKKDFSNLFENYQFNKPQCRYTCIHIRRGDCTKEEHPQWFVEDDFYINLIILLCHELPDDHELHICTQGPINWITENISNSILHMRKLYIHSTRQSFTNDSEIEDFF